MEKIMNFFAGVKDFFETAAKLRIYGELKMAGKDVEAEKIRLALIDGYSRS